MIDLPAKPLHFLSMWNPWAWALFRAGKTVENRTWNSRFRGWVAIQVSKYWELNEVKELIKSVQEAAVKSGRPCPEVDLHELHEQRGHVIGLVRIDDWKPAREYSSPWAFHEGFGAHIAQAVEIDPIECRGMPGLPYLPILIEKQVRTKFEEACVRLGL